jgi:DNA-binding transcriptional MerR regulator
MSVADKTLRSGQLARLTGVSPDTIRHYERVGILPESPRTPAGYRVYPADATARVRLVQHALQLGFTLTELSEILRQRDSAGAPCRRVLNMTERKLRQLEQRIRELRQTGRYMRQLVRQWKKQLEHTPPGKKAMLLHTLAGKPAPPVNSGAHTLIRRKSR